MQAICFCSISLNKKTKNKRANATDKEQELNLAMDHNFKVNDQAIGQGSNINAMSILRNI